MQKITWDMISLELTRKCQIKCRHCYKGDAQNETMSLETIDNLLKRTEIIGTLHLSGGEPTMALDQMDFIADKMFEYGIPLFNLMVITNGYDKPERFMEIIKKFYRIIEISSKFEKGYDVQKSVCIGVSCDRYHMEQGYNPMAAVKYYRHKLGKYATVFPNYDGDLPFPDGRAKDLQEAFNVNLNYKKMPQRVEYLTVDHKPMCPHGLNYDLLHEDQIYIVCDLSVSVYGDIRQYSEQDTGYLLTDNRPKICNINTTSDIIADLEAFNRGKISCLDKMKLEKKEMNSFSTRLKCDLEMIRVIAALKAQGYNAEKTLQQHSLFNSRQLMNTESGKSLKNRNGNVSIAEIDKYIAEIEKTNFLNL